jgi:putative restriction endonuclease
MPLTDDAIRLAAFNRLAELRRKHGPILNWDQLHQPIKLEGEDILISSAPRGIFRPRQMRRGVLSIKTTRPKEGRTPRYDDLAPAENDGVFLYRFQGTDPDARDNVALREAFEDQTPLIYLFGVAPGVYDPLWPVFITGWNPAHLTAEVSVQAQPGLLTATDAVTRLREPIERYYATVQAKTRLHQQAFRFQVLDAYQHRCAVCGFPRDELLDAAHILPDHDERGRPEVPNGLCLCKLHHSGYDANLLGIRPDGVIEISPALKRVKDGPTLEHGFLGFDGKPILLPVVADDRPRPDYLEERYETFRAAG